MVVAGWRRALRIEWPFIIIIIITACPRKKYFYYHYCLPAKKYAHLHICRGICLGMHDMVLKDLSYFLVNVFIYLVQWYYNLFLTGTNCQLPTSRGHTHTALYTSPPLNSGAFHTLAVDCISLSLSSISCLSRGQAHEGCRL